ncbi:MAG TPA: aromatic ring-hydroxylating dioxygenase subunit alpha [Terriglobia bacterium]|nr:aromatic ring-hydroxylating dioxygenase subunit alpha [Terriglobia bacterium]
MLSNQDNELLTRVGPGTAMGELLRRYWMPIAALTEFEKETVRPVRLLGEDLVLYKDQAGTFGLVDRHCAHRRADLSYGFVEDCGLRCNYHGWRYDEKGRCIEQPYEDTAAPQARFKDRIHITAYPVESRAGLIWAYLGPSPAPLVPNWEPFTWTNGFRQIVFADVPCNWFQAQENSIDPVHFEWMHMNWGVRLRGKTGPYSPKHLKVAFDEFEYGFVYRRIREGMNESDTLWTTGRVCLWPNALFTGNHFEWRVPVDDENTLSVTWCFSRVPKEREPYVQDRIPAWHGPVKDPYTGRWISSHIMNQDFIAWTGQGTTADRTKEHLGTSDQGIVMLRKRFVNDIELIAQGKDPKAIIRDPEINKCVGLPVAERQALTEGLPFAQLRKHPLLGRELIDGYPFQAGQPEEVRKLFEEAMGTD